MLRLSSMRVLLVGDSHLAGFAGDELQRRLEAAGAIVTRNARVGRSALDLTKQEAALFAQNLANVAPQLVVFSLGTNDPPTPATFQAFQKLAGQANAIASEVWAIGPPSFAPDAKAADGSSLVDRAAANAGTMRSIFGSRFIDSRPATAGDLRPPARTADLVHFNKSAGTTWGASNAAAIVSGRRRWKVAAGVGVAALLLGVVLAARSRA